jgi:hypothetical protein
MSSVGKWTKKAEEATSTVLTNDRSTPVIVCLVNVRQVSMNMRWANDRPDLRTCALGLHLTRQARWTT